MKTPHKHAEVIHAWADGATVQYRSSAEHNWADLKEPTFFNEIEYRIKPEPKPDVVFYLGRELSGAWFQTTLQSARSLMLITQCGETGKLKSVEVV